MIILSCQKNDEEQISTPENKQRSLVKNAARWILGKDESRLGRMESRRKTWPWDIIPKGKENMPPVQGHLKVGVPPSDCHPTHHAA